MKRRKRKCDIRGRGKGCSEEGGGELEEKYEEESRKRRGRKNEK